MHNILFLIDKSNLIKKLLKNIENNNIYIYIGRKFFFWVKNTKNTRGCRQSFDQ